MSLLKHKDIDANRISNLLFLDFDKNEKTRESDLEMVMDVYRTYGRGIKFTFVPRKNQDQSEKSLTDAIEDLVCIENN